MFNKFKEIIGLEDEDDFIEEMEENQEPIMEDFDFGEIPVETKTQVQVDADEYQSIVLKSEVKKDEYTNYIQDTFDLKVCDVSKVCIPNKLNIIPKNIIIVPIATIVYQNLLISTTNITKNYYNYQYN